MVVHHISEMWHEFSCAHGVEIDVLDSRDFQPVVTLDAVDEALAAILNLMILLPLCDF